MRADADFFCPSALGLRAEKDEVGYNFGPMFFVYLPFFILPCFQFMTAVNTVGLALQFGNPYSFFMLALYN